MTDLPTFSSRISSRALSVWSGVRGLSFAFYRLTSPLFPNQPVFFRTFSWPRKLLLLGIMTAAFSLLGLLLPPGGYVGFDWTHFFGIGVIAPFQPPWTKAFTDLLTWPLLVGLGLAAFSLAALQRSVHPASIAAAFFCLPLLWTIFLGQIEGIALLGLVGLPWLAPLALLKPQITFFAFGARRVYILAFVVVMLVSFLVFGPWWNAMLNVESFYAEGRYPQNIALGWWGLPVFLATLWFSRGDMDMLMLSGAFITPHLIPYNLLPLTPAIARLRPRYALIAALLSWLPLVCANFLGEWGWWTGWIFPAWLWINLAQKRYPGFLSQGFKHLYSRSI
jgi:hypothetical protein